MKFLILSITAGQGHHQCAKAIHDMMTARGHEGEIIDTYKYMNSALGTTVDKAYLLSTKYLPDIYGGFYNIADKSEFGSTLTVGTQRLFFKKLHECITKAEPDVIFCTHVFPAVFLTRAKERGYLSGVKTIGIVTDFTIHPYWELTDLDAYVTASELLIFQCEKKKINKERVHGLGIPIRQEFSYRKEKCEARSLLGLPDKDTVLVMSGSMGHGNLPQLVERIDSIEGDFVILAVCGNNKRGKANIEKLECAHEVVTYGFVDNVDLLMDAADFIVTKPGGLSVSECMAKQLPMILVEPIPGQENRNLEFLLNNGLAYSVTGTYPIEEAVYQFLHSDWRRETFKKSMEAVGRPNATRDVCRLAEELVGSC